MGKRHYPPAMDHPNGESGIGLGQLGVALEVFEPREKLMGGGELDDCLALRNQGLPILELLAW
jgi:hypothetical protein